MRSSEPATLVARRVVLFDDEFFDSLSAQAPPTRSAQGIPSRTDLLAYEIPPLMDVLADDYESSTLAVGETDSLRILVQSGRLVRTIVLWCELVDDVVRVFDVVIELFDEDAG